MIYADNAATTKMTDGAIEVMTECMKNVYGNPSSLHSAGQRAAEVLLDSRKKVARCLGCEANEIYFTSGGSEADNQALVTAAAIGKKKGKTHIISTTVEHHAILHTLKELERNGFEIELLPCDETGAVTAEQVKNAIKDTTALVTVMYANNEIGTINPISEIGAVCREKNVLFHTDAVQAAGHLKINVKDENIDMLSLSAHKFGGPKGTGVLYARKGISLKNIIFGGAQEKGKRAGTENVPAIAAMAYALEQSCANMESNAESVSALRDKIINGLSLIPHSVLNGSRKNRLPGNINYIFEGIEGESLLLLLDDKGICASSGSACTSGSLDPSHVLLAIGRIPETAHGSLRLSIDETLSEKEADYIVESVKEVVEYLRNMSPLWHDKVEGRREFYL